MDGQSLNTYVETEHNVESAEYVDTMLAKAAQIEANNNPDREERPEWLPEKFRSMEDLAKAYSELEKKLGRGEYSEEGENEQNIPSEDEILDNSVEDVESLINANGLDFNVLQNEFNQYGTVTEESFAELEEAGFPRPVVETWIAGQIAIADQVKNNVFNMAGGAETYNSMLSWASDNLSEGEIDAFNNIIATQDTNMISLAVNSLMSKFSANTEPTLMRGGTGSASSSVFRSTAELTTAMNDPRYAKDSAYRDEVARKLSLSSLF